MRGSRGWAGTWVENRELHFRTRSCTVDAGPPQCGTCWEAQTVTDCTQQNVNRCTPWAMTR
jgi:hypothetical protein